MVRLLVCEAELGQPLGMSEAFSANAAEAAALIGWHRTIQPSVAAIDRFSAGSPGNRQSGPGGSSPREGSVRLNGRDCS